MATEGSRHGVRRFGSISLSKRTAQIYQQVTRSLPVLDGLDTVTLRSACRHLASSEQPTPVPTWSSSGMTFALCPLPSREAGREGPAPYGGRG